MTSFLDLTAAYPCAIWKFQHITLQKEEDNEELPPPLIFCDQHVSINSGSANTGKNRGVTYGLSIAMVFIFLSKID